MTRPARLLLLSICAAVLGLSVSLFLREYSVVFLLRGTTNDQIDTLAQAPSTPRPASARTTRELLVACGRIITTAPRLRAEPQTAAAVRAACQRVSAAILDRAPLNARAAAVALLSETPGFSADELADAQIRAPYEPWPLLMRIEAAAEQTESSPVERSAILALAGQDIARALLFPWGRDRLAALYADRPDMRATIGDAVTTLPAQDQRAFLSALRTATGESR